MDLSVWLALMALFFAGGLTPGPAVMMVMSASLRYGAPTALVPAAGVSAANLVWISLAATGIATFAAQAPLVLMGLKIAGICFIAWLAWTMATADPHRPRARADHGGIQPQRAYAPILRRPHPRRLRARTRAAPARAERSGAERKS